MSESYSLGLRAQADRLRNTGQVIRPETLPNMARGALAVPEMVAGIVGASETAQRLGAVADQVTGQPLARYDVDPRSAAEQTLGGSFIGVPAGAVPSVIRSGVGAAATRFPNLVGRPLRAVEAMTPMTLPLNPRNIAVNAAVGAVAAPVIEEGIDQLRGTIMDPPDDNALSVVETPARAVVDTIRDAGGAAVNAIAQTTPARKLAELVTGDKVSPHTLSTLITGQEPAPRQSSPAARAIMDPDEPAERAIMDAETGTAIMDADDKPPRTVGQWVADNAVYLLGAAGGAVGAGALNRARRSAENAATSATAVAPGSPRDPTVQQPGMATSAAGQVFDEHAPGRKVVRMMEQDGTIGPEQREQLYAALDVGTNKTARQGQAEAFVAQGIAPDGRRISRPLREQTTELRKLEPDVAAAVREAMVLVDEAGMRKRAIDEGVPSKINDPATGMPAMVQPRFLDKSTGRWEPDYSVDWRTGAVTPKSVVEPARVGFTDLSYDDLHDRLRGYIADPRIGPHVEAAIREQTDYAEKSAAYLVRNGYIDQQTANRFRSANPQYLHQIDAEDTASGLPYGYRRVEEGARPDKAQDPMQAKQDHMLAMITGVEHNNAKRTAARAFEKWEQSKPPGSKRVFGRVLKDSEQSDAPAVFTFREDGIKYKMEVYRPEIAEAMSNKPKTTLGFLDGQRKWYQNFITGPIAAAVGQVFTPFTWMFNIQTGLGTRAPGTSSGWIDKGLQKIGLPGLRGDPTFIAQSVMQIVKDLSAATARELAYVPGIRGTTFAQKLTSAYHNSTYALMQRIGAVNTGGAYKGDYATRIRADIGAVDPWYDATRPVLAGQPRNVTEWRDWARQQALSAPAGAIRRGWQLFKEGLDIWANSPQSAYFAQNLDQVTKRFTDNALSPQDAQRALGRRARQLGADPSISGSNRGWQGFVSMQPYTNIALQSYNTWGKAIRENPMGTAMAYGTQAAMLAALSMYSAYKYDEDARARGLEGGAARDLLLGNSYQNVAIAKFYIPGYGIAQMPGIPVDPILGPGRVAMMQMMRQIWPIDQPEFHGPQMEGHRKALEAMIENADDRQWTASLVRGFSPFTVPPLAAGAAALKGYDIADMFQLFGQGRIRDNRASNVSGYEQGQIRGDPIPPTVTDIVQSIGGAVGVVTEAAMRTAFTVGQKLGFDTGAVAAIDQTVQASQDRIPGAPALFEGHGRNRAYDANAELTADYRTKLRTISQGYADITVPGTIGGAANREVSTLGPGRKQVTPEMVQVLTHFHKLGQDKGFQLLQADINKSMERIRELRSNPVPLSKPYELRRHENAINETIRGLNARVVQRVVDVETRLEELTGRRVRLQTLDPSQGIEQFAEIER